MKEKKPFVVAVAGPTASGKSALAMALCRRYGGELISCDSMQVYRRMDIGTAKPTAAERAEIPHHLIDICEPTESFSAAAFAALAKKAISDTVQRGRLPVLCGGTGLYLDSVLSGVEFGELEPDPALRAELWRAEEEKGPLFLHQMLEAVDPEAAHAIHPNNVKRVVRALEICRLSGMTKTEWDKRARREGPYKVLYIALDYHDRALLYEKIDRRVDAMMAAGLWDEVRALLAEGALVPGTTAAGAIGYKELLGCLDTGKPLAQASEEIKNATHHYAKRQLTWLRRNPEILWLYPDDYPTPELLFQAAEKAVDQTNQSKSGNAIWNREQNPPTKK